MDSAFDITIIGAGVIGLAVAAEVSRLGYGICVVERHGTFGMETSSRNSEVVHSGIYYPQDTLKANLCVRGKIMLYELCEKHDLPHKKLGKLIVASHSHEVQELERLKENGERNGVCDLIRVSRRELARLEPNVPGEAALFSPSTGIIDSHALMKHYERRARENETIFSYNAEVQGLCKEPGGYRIEIRQEKETHSFLSRAVINCAGLGSDRIATVAGMDIDKENYRICFSKGEYFKVIRRPETGVNHLIYPVPQSDSGWLGVHITLDLQEQMKLGPSAESVDKIDYTVNSAHQKLFYEAARKYLPRLAYDDIWPDMAGIRPKLAKEDEGFRDFIIRHENEKGLPGFINLIGIESPGLTCSPAIAAYVADIVRSFL
jgi:L-2-hydroxyglutarate oxidase LhgO